MEPYQCIDFKLAGYQKVNGLTKEQVAKRLGMSDVSLWRKRSGNGDFTLSETFKVAELLDMTLDQLFDRQ